MTDPDFATGSWPTQARDSVLNSQPADTVVDVAPPPVAPHGPAPDQRFGAGMLLGIAAVTLALAGAAIAYFLTHRDSKGQVTTVVVRSTAPTAGGASTSATAPSKPTVTQAAPTPTTPAATTTPTTTTTTASAPPPPADATVPDVSDQKEAAAVQLLNQAGILASLFFVPGSEPLGMVKAVAKPAGTTVPYHSHVQINVSIGPGDKPTEQVPNVVGQTLQEALTSINGAQLRLIYVKLPVTSQSEAGKIVQQSPLGGGHAPQHAQIVVFLGAFRG